MKFFKQLVIGGMLAVMILLLSGCGVKVAVNQYDDLAKSLTAVRAKIYGTSQCGACIYQKELFGSSWQYIDYVECTSPDGVGSQAAVCKEENIKAYPTWRFANGDEVVGVMAIEQLKQKINFESNE